MVYNFFKISFCTLLINLFIQQNVYADTAGVNSAATVLCEIISLLRGRIGRAITMFALLGICMGFVIGKLSWQRLIVLCVGIGIFYGAEAIAFVILPSTVTGITGTLSNGTVFNPNNKYTPQFILANVCPELSMFGSGTNATYTTGGSERLPGVSHAPGVSKT